MTMRDRLWNGKSSKSVGPNSLIGMCALCIVTYRPHASIQIQWLCRLSIEDAHSDNETGVSPDIAV
ncbi:MAG: hypothetical protein AAFQ16_11745, partial [Pseudomonadota bacterium]